MREEYWPDIEGYYSDMSHLNTYGASAFSTVFSLYVKGEIDYDDLFYSSVREKYESLPANFYGLEYRDVTVVDEYIDCRLITNHPESMQSRIIFTDNDEGQNVLKEMSSGTDFSIPVRYSGLCTVEVVFEDGKPRSYEFTF